MALDLAGNTREQSRRGSRVRPLGAPFGVLFGFVSGLLLIIGFFVAVVPIHERIDDPRTPEWVRKTMRITYNTLLFLALVSQPIVLTYRIAGSHSANRFRDQLPTILIYLIADFGIAQSLRDALRRHRRARV